MYLDRAAWIKTFICSSKLAKKTWRGGGMGQEVGEGEGLFMNFWSLRPNPLAICCLFKKNTYFSTLF